MASASIQKHKEEADRLRLSDQTIEYIRPLPAFAKKAGVWLAFAVRTKNTDPLRRAWVRIVYTSKTLAGVNWNGLPTSLRELRVLAMDTARAANAYRSGSPIVMQVYQPSGGKRG